MAGLPPIFLHSQTPSEKIFWVEIRRKHLFVLLYSSQPEEQLPEIYKKQLECILSSYIKKKNDKKNKNKKNYKLTYIHGFFYSSFVFKQSVAWGIEKEMKTTH